MPDVALVSVAVTAVHVWTASYLEITDSESGSEVNHKGRNLVVRVKLGDKSERYTKSLIPRAQHSNVPLAPSL